MGTVTSPRQVEITSELLHAYAIQTQVGQSWQIVTDARTDAELQTLVDAAPDAATAGTAANDAALRAKARQALTTNSAYLGLANPTTAQSAAQIKALTRECNGLIKLLLGLVADTTDT